ncbi:MAG TPA: hypothetical protein VHK65_10860 [Candidatus Dormibacteraeota bacterium]|nr:hypothetical protein [Candidatus Dormibacteraeota bacterium]
MRQVPLQAVWPVGQPMHALPWQTWPLEQAWPQLPQLLTSLVVSTHVGFPLTGQTALAG